MEKKDSRRELQVKLNVFEKDFGLVQRLESKLFNRASSDKGCRLEKEEIYFLYSLCQKVYLKWFKIRRDEREEAAALELLEKRGYKVSKDA